MLEGVPALLNVTLRSPDNTETKVEDHFLVPEGTLGLPLPVSLPPASGIVTESGYRGWGYGEWSGPQTMTESIQAGHNFEALASIFKLGPTISELSSSISEEVNQPKPMAGVFAAFASPEKWSPFNSSLAAVTNNAITFGPKDFVSALLPKQGSDSIGLAAKNLLTAIMDTRSKVFGSNPLQRSVNTSGTPAWVSSCDDVSITANTARSARCLGISSKLTPPIPISGVAPSNTGQDDLSESAERVAACPFANPKTTLTGGITVGKTGNLGFLSVGGSLSGSLSMPLTDYRDMTGDGIPDVVLWLPARGIFVLRTEIRPLHRSTFVPLNFGGEHLALNASFSVSPMSGSMKMSIPAGIAEHGKTREPLPRKQP